MPKNDHYGILSLGDIFPEFLSLGIIIYLLTYILIETGSHVSPADLELV